MVGSQVFSWATSTVMVEWDLVTEFEAPDLDLGTDDAFQILVFRGEEP